MRAPYLQGAETSTFLHESICGTQKPTIRFKPLSNLFQYKNAEEIVNRERKGKVETDTETGTSAVEKRADLAA